MYLIVGLGNFEKKYDNTFHNTGFMCVEKFAEKLGVTFSKKECRSLTAHTRIANHKVIIAKPTTYMNLSGIAIQELVDMYNISLDKLIVVYDDADLPIGDIRIRTRGSAGTHNGMKSVVNMLSTTDIIRIRVGIFRQSPMALVDYVLSKLTVDDKIILEKSIDSVADALQYFCQGNTIDSVMQRYNLHTNRA